MNTTNKNATNEASKDTGRMVILGAVSTIVTYVLQLVFPSLPIEVQGSVLALILAGLTWFDSWLHHNQKIKISGLIPF